MIREFRLPDVGEGVAEGELVEWLVEPGDAVHEDQPVAEVETDKALVEIPSPYDGTVHELHAEPGEVVPVGEVIVSFDVPEAAVEGTGAADAGGEDAAGTVAADDGDGGSGDGEGTAAGPPAAGAGGEDAKAARA
ncbi:MAG: biotin/lipoyl-containing protein, partial [Haloferacaceae archaeon]